MDENLYNVVSVEKADSPEGGEGNNWCRYVIGRGTSQIVGNRRGSVAQVTAHAKTLAEDLNSRTGLRSPSSWSSRRKK